MMKNTPAIIFICIILISAFGVMAAPAEGTGLFDIIGNAVDKILSIGSLTFLFGDSADNKFFGFIRISYAILIFAVLYMGLSLIPNFSRQTAITIGIILAIISAVFTPTSLLATFGTTYATIFALLFIVGPIIGVLALLFMTGTPSRLVAGLKILALTALLLIVNEISHWAIALANAS